MKDQLTFEDYNILMRKKSKRLCRHCKYFVIDRFGHFSCYRKNEVKDLGSQVKCPHFIRRANWIAVEKQFQ